MANDEAGERSEEPTSRQLDKAREEGRIAKSKELTSGVMLVLSMIFLYFYFPYMVNECKRLVREVFQSLNYVITPDSVTTLFFFSLTMMGKIVLPFMVFLFVIVFGIELMQGGGLTASTKAMEPKWDKLNFIKNFPKVFFGKRKLVDLLKSIFKILVLGALAVQIISSKLPVILKMTDAEYMDSSVFMIKFLFELVFKISLVVIFLGILDYMYQKWQHKQDLKMTKQQVKEEYKQMEGDPLIKRRIRSAQQELARKRMMEDVPSADVVVTNPIHYAVALKYEPQMGGAPLVVAKGQRLMALKIKDIARENGIYIHEDPPLAQTLYKTLDIGDQIPENLYKAVAEILSIVYKAKNKKVG